MDNEDIIRAATARIKVAAIALEDIKDLFTSGRIEVGCILIDSYIKRLSEAAEMLDSIHNPPKFLPGGISTGRADEFIISPTGKPREFSFSAKIDADKLNSVDFDFYSAANLMGLKTKLDEAVKAERFEEAAELRDKIEQIKGKQNEK